MIYLGPKTEWESLLKAEVAYREGTGSFFVEGGRDPLMHRKATEALETLYQFVGANQEDDLFLFQSYEELLLQLYMGGVLERGLLEGRNLLLTTHSFHPALQLLQRKAARMGLESKVIEVGQLSDHKRALIFSLRYADPLTGVIEPIFEIAEWCKKWGILFHVDVTEVLQTHFFHWDGMDIDLLSIDGGRLGGTFFPSLLFVKRGISCTPLLFDLKKPLESSLAYKIEPLLAIGALCHEILEKKEEFVLEASRLQMLFEKQWKEGAVSVLYQDKERLPTHTLLHLPFVNISWVLTFLQKKGGVAPAAYHSVEGCLMTLITEKTTEKEIMHGAALLKEAYRLALQISGESL